MLKVCLGLKHPLTEESILELYDAEEEQRMATLYY